MFRKAKGPTPEDVAAMQEEFQEQMLTTILNICDVYEQFRLEKLRHVDGILANPFIGPDERFQAMVGREIFMAEGLAHMEIRDGIETQFRKNMKITLAWAKEQWKK